MPSTKSAAPSSPIRGSRLIELRTSMPPDGMMQRLACLMADVEALMTLPDPQARAIYRELEATRDVLSQILDRADGKSQT